MIKYRQILWLQWFSGFLTEAFLISYPSKKVQLLASVFCVCVGVLDGCVVVVGDGHRRFEISIWQAVIWTGNAEGSCIFSFERFPIE